jgi:predicted DNA-binding protein (MmcQ/YjbR family)
MTAAKKTAAKKTAAKKTAAKKTAAKKTAAKKTAAKKPAAKRPAAKKTAAKPPTSTPLPPELAAVQRLRDDLRAYAFALPGAWEDHPWGESVAKVGKKVFVFFGMSSDAYLREGLGMSVKLPQTGDLVLALPFAEPTGYGLGRSGWVSIRIPPDDLPPLPMLTAWIDESYRAVAPKKEVAALAARRPT